MSVKVPYRKRDFLAPSKTLQEWKEKLGPMYFNAKLIECPQNAVELGKLLQKWEYIDKQKFKRLSETSRQQRFIQRILLSREVPDSSSSSAVARASSDRSILSCAVNRTPLTPGFRFHSNGDPKMDLDIMDDIPASSRKPTYADEVNVVDSSNRNRQDTHTETNCYGHKKMVRPKEKVDEAKRLDALLSRAQSNATKAEMYRSYFNRPSATFVFDPDLKVLPDKRDKSAVSDPSLGWSTSSPSYNRTSRCLACTFKIMHVGDEFKISYKDNRKERWSIPPTGRFLTTPSVQRVLNKNALPKSKSERFPKTPDRDNDSKPLSQSISVTIDGDPYKYARGCSSEKHLISSAGGRSRQQRPSTSPDMPRKFSSLKDKETRIQCLKSRAVEDAYTCRAKVKSFLRDMTT